MKFLNPVFLPTLFILTVAATPPSWAQPKAKRSKAKRRPNSKELIELGPLLPVLLAALCHPG